MGNYSITVVSLVVMVLGRFLGWAGIEIGNEQITTFIQVLVGLLSAVGVWYGRYRKGDIEWYGKRK